MDKRRTIQRSYLQTNTQTNSRTHKQHALCSDAKPAKEEEQSPIAADAPTDVKASDTPAEVTQEDEAAAKVWPRRILAQTSHALCICAHTRTNKYIYTNMNIKHKHIYVDTPNPIRCGSALPSRPSTLAQAKAKARQARMDQWTKKMGALMLR